AHAHRAERLQAVEVAAAVEATIRGALGRTWCRGRVRDCRDSVHALAFAAPLTSPPGERRVDGEAGRTSSHEGAVDDEVGLLQRELTCCDGLLDLRVRREKAR